MREKIPGVREEKRLNNILRRRIEKMGLQNLRTGALQMTQEKKNLTCYYCEVFVSIRRSRVYKQPSKTIKEWPFAVVVNSFGVHIFKNN